jgi:hypothetical protein
MEENSKDFVQLSQLYAEPGVSFDEVLNWKKVREWRIILEKKNKSRRPF